MEKSASNFELNILKLGVHTFQLQKGDRFETNGRYFNYIPSTSENKGKGTYRRFSGRRDDISAKKYQKDVERADNIELIHDEFLSVGSDGTEWRKKVWEVQYAYKIDIPKNENIVLLSITLDWDLDGSMDRNKIYNWKFNTEEIEIERVTAGNYFLKKNHPITYHTQIPKTDMDIVHTRFDKYYIMCFMDDYNDMEQALFTYVENAIHNKIQSGHDIVRRETDNLNKFLLLKSKQGY